MPAWRITVAGRQHGGGDRDSHRTIYGVGVGHSLHFNAPLPIFYGSFVGRFGVCAVGATTMSSESSVSSN